MSDFLERLPKNAEIWEHTSSGQRYVILGSTFNTITDQVDVLYAPMVVDDFDRFTRQMLGHEKAFLSKLSDGRPRFRRISDAAGKAVVAP